MRRKKYEEELGVRSRKNAELKRGNEGDLAERKKGATHNNKPEGAMKPKKNHHSVASTKKRNSKK